MTAQRYLAIFFFSFWGVCHVSATRSDYTATIEVPGRTSWGSWGSAEWCPEGSYAYAFRLKVESIQGGGDDTGLNAIKLFCTKPELMGMRRPQREVSNVGTVTSTIGLYGSWGFTRQCHNNRFLTGANLRSEPSQGWWGDDTAANNVNFECQKHTPDQPNLILGSGTPYGDWMGWKRCPTDSVICGLKTKVEGKQGGGDDTSLNGAEFYCCRKPLNQVIDSSSVVKTPDAREWVPTLKLDRAHKCFPGSASVSENGICRSSFNDSAEIYYDSHICDDGKSYKLTYWFFYGWQVECFLSFGSHDNDWEHVTVNFKLCDLDYCIDSIHYSQHGGWYTRQYGYEDERRSADVFVGKIGHGNYHNSCCASGCSEYCHGGCEYFHDFRNPGEVWTPTNIQPVSVAESAGGEVGKKITEHHMRQQCGRKKCDDDGCRRNNWQLYV